MEGIRPVEIIARGNKKLFKGYEADDMNWAIMTFEDGAVINLGVSYALPAHYPTQGQSDRVELLGIDGAMMIDDDHLNHLLYTEKGVAHAYIPGHSEDMVFLGSTTPGDWAAGDFWGPMANETRAWLDHLVTGSPTVQTTPQQARLNLEATLAIVRAVQTGKPVTLPFNG
jgi:predicted dehydrogenase